MPEWPLIKKPEAAVSAGTGEAGESCAFYIARRLGMAEETLETAWKAAYGNR